MPTQTISASVTVSASVSVDEQILPTGGEIVPQDDRDRLVRALEKWLGDQELIQRTRRGARKKAEEMFDIRVISNQLWLEYQSLLPEAAA
jgi:glycosyltransferase involved in cell wall biosynthesis